MFCFLTAIKLCLLSWQIFVNQRNPLADAPPDAIFVLAGPDLFICFLLSVILAATGSLDDYGDAGRWIGRVMRGAVCLFVIFFSVVSFQVARIYGDPLDIELLRSGDDLMVLRDSIRAYAGALPGMLMVVGVIGVPLIGKMAARRLSKRQWCRERSQLWTVACAISVAAAGVQWLRLHGIDTMGVKDNAIVFFLKSYKPVFRPIDAPKLAAAVEARNGPSLQRTELPTSLLHPDQMITRDFKPAEVSANGFNLVIIQMESTSALHVNEKSAPHILSLGAQGVSFRRHSTIATQTLKASCGIYYSDYLPELGTTLNLLYGRPMPQLSLAEVLKAAGYHTAVFHTGFLDYLGIRFLFRDKGVDTLVGAREMVEQGIPLAYSAAVREESTVEELTQWIGEHKDEKFFATYLTECPHHPYMSLSEHNPYEDDDNWEHRYENSMHYADECVGKLIEYLKIEGLLEKTLVVVVGDHGETVSTYPVGHGLRLSIEETRTPFIVSNPKLFPTATESKLYTSHLDVAPTLVRLLGVTPPAQWLGRDLFASELPAVIQFVSITHIRTTATIDNGIMCATDHAGRVEMFDIGESDLMPMEAGNPHARLARQYEGELKWYTDWSLWRHLKRAQSNDDVARTKASSEKSPQANSKDRTSPQG